MPDERGAAMLPVVPGGEQQSTAAAAAADGDVLAEWQTLIPEDGSPTPTPPVSGARRPFDGREKWRSSIGAVSRGALISQSFSQQLKVKADAAKASADDGTPAPRTGSSQPSSAGDVDDDGVPAVVRAAAEGMVAELRRLIAQMPVDPTKSVADELDTITIKEGPDAGQNAMIKAARNNHGRCVDVLLEAGASSVVNDKKWRSAWYYACFGVRP